MEGPHFRLTQCAMDKQASVNDFGESVDVLVKRIEERSVLVMQHLVI
jgi:hypothetical protein